MFSDALRHYISLLMAGFAGNPHMIACTVLALSKLIFDFKGEETTNIVYLSLSFFCFINNVDDVLISSCVIQLFSDDVSSALLKILVDSACLLLASKAREVVKSALSFVKVLVTSFDALTFGEFLKRVVCDIIYCLDY